MANQQYIYNISGIITDIIDTDMAIIKFHNNGNYHGALMQKDTFYYNGRVIGNNENWDDYISVGIVVKFNARDFLESDKYQYCKWCVTICWPMKSNLLNEVTIKTGFIDIKGRVFDINDQRGILKIYSANRQYYKILFTSNNIYINEIKFTGKYLKEVLNINEVITFDAIPCFHYENNDDCKWFASIVYKGKRPNFISNKSTINTSNNENLHLYEFWKTIYESSNLRDYLYISQKNFFNDNFKKQCSNFIQQYINNPQNVFICGKGMIMEILNDEFGILIGELKKNFFQTIIFHRRSVFLYKMPLTSLDLIDVLQCGDRMKFIAIRAPCGFLTEWIAVQISVLDNQLQDDDNDDDDDDFSD